MVVVVLRLLVLVLTYSGDGGGGRGRDCGVVDVVMDVTIFVRVDILLFWQFYS